jgi:ribosomal protein L37AE/L43A
MTDGEDAGLESAAKLTVVLPEWDCGYCGAGPRVSREDGAWVCLRCGMSVAAEVADRADDRLAAGEGEHGIIAQEVEQIASDLAPTLEALDSDQ